MNIKQMTSADLCRELSEGWTAEHPDAPRELLVRLRGRWQAEVESETPRVSAYRAVLELNKVHLLGASALGCLILGQGAKVEQEVSEFWQQHGGSGRLTLVLAANAALRDAARNTAFAERCLFLGNGEIEGLLTHPQPLELLKEHLRRQVPIRRLLPYDITHPVASNMFFGRRDLLDRFLQEETTSFAIAGPGRIGKSSLLKQYVHELRRNKRDDRKDRVILVDCYPYASFSPDELAQRLALDISADSEAHRVNASTLQRFLKRHSLDGHRPLELLLDEVDSVCLSKAFEQLAEAVRFGYCRVILCGRGNLYRTMKEETHQFENRLELIRPEPLDAESARQLLLRPLGDLGIAPEDEAALLKCVFDLSARRPHLVQHCAKLLFQFADSDGSKTIAARHLQRLREWFMEMTHAMLPLKDLTDDLTRLMTLLWLREGGGVVTVGSFQALATKHGVALSATQALEICDQLWICNVLTWERGVLALASTQLVDFVRRMDFNTEIARLKRVVEASRVGKS